MTRPADLQKLITWLSPAFPVGAFAWSAGLEQAIVAGTVHNRASTQDWISGNLQHGGLHTDAILFAQAHKASESIAELQQIADLCLALTPAQERHQETTTTGKAFALAAKAWPTTVLDHLPDPCPYPVAVGAIVAGHGIDIEDAILAWLTSAVHSQVSVAVRLVPIGQTDGLAIMADLEPLIASIAAACQHATLADIGSIAYAADIAQMSHETQTTRIFRS